MWLHIYAESSRFTGGPHHISISQQKKTQPNDGLAYSASSIHATYSSECEPAAHSSLLNGIGLHNFLLEDRYFLIAFSISIFVFLFFPRQDSFTLLHLSAFALNCALNRKRRVDGVFSPRQSVHCTIYSIQLGQSWIVTTTTQIIIACEQFKKHSEAQQRCFFSFPPLLSYQSLQMASSYYLFWKMIVCFH